MSNANPALPGIKALFWWWALLAVAGFGAAVGLALHHPLFPAVAALFVVGCMLASARWQGLWLVTLPACLPWLNFSPWTGWLIFEEFDLLVLAMYAGAYLGLARQERSAQEAANPPDRVALCLVWVMAVCGAVSLARGLMDAGGIGTGWFQGYTDPLNSVRVGKGLLFGVLSWPLLRAQMQVSPEGTYGRLAWGVVLGLVVVVLAVLWERLAYAGLFDFRGVYRATALFWEMHIGGGAIDAYLALAMPFALWALRAARGAWGRGAAGLLVALTAYASLTTFSRGVYAALVLCVVVVAIMSFFLHRKSVHRTEASIPEASPRAAGFLGWRVYAWLMLVVTLLLVAMLGPRSFMTNRLVHTDKVLDGRLAHWRNALELPQTPADWILGVGLGRFPAHYVQTIRGGQLAGQVQWHGGDGPTPQAGSYATLRGPSTDPDLEGLFALTQRVDVLPGRRYQIDLAVRARFATPLVVEVCERHLLYDWNCQGYWLLVPDTQGAWQNRHLPLRGPAFPATPWYAHRLGMLALSVPDIGSAVDVANIRLVASDGTSMLANGNFGAGLASWFPAAQYYFLPWHADSLYLEVLVERGMAGLLLLVALLALAGTRLVPANAQGLWFAPYMAASLAGLVLVGCVSSLMDVPRVAWLFWLVLLLSLQKRPQY